MSFPELSVQSVAFVGATGSFLLLAARYVWPLIKGIDVPDLDLGGGGVHAAVDNLEELEEYLEEQNNTKGVELCKQLRTCILVECDEQN